MMNGKKREFVLMMIGFEKNNFFFLLTQTNVKLAWGEWCMETGTYDHDCCGMMLDKGGDNGENRRLFKMLGGSSVPQIDMPWAVGIFVDGKFACTGTLVSKYDVIVIASCLDSMTGCNRIDEKAPHELNMLEIEEQIRDRVRIKIGAKLEKEMLVQEVRFGSYSQMCAINQIAVLRMEEEASPHLVNHICLPWVYIDEWIQDLYGDGRVEGNVRGPTLFAWNLNDCAENNNNCNAAELKKFKFEDLKGIKDCEKMVTGLNEKFTWDLMCYGGDKEGSLCKDHDNGAGVAKVFPTSDGYTRWFLIGLASRLPDCENSEFENIFTYIPYQAEEIKRWIQEKKKPPPIRPTSSSTTTTTTTSIGESTNTTENNRTGQSMTITTAATNPTDGYDMNLENDEWLDEGICVDDDG